MKIKTLFLLPLILLFGCKDRSEVIQFNTQKVSFKNGYVNEMPKLRNSEKRGFADFTCDGVEDMIEINDEKFFGQDYKFNLFEGYINNGIIQYKPKKVIDLGIKLHGWSSQTKMDTADVNGDGCADVVFSDMSSGWRNVKLRLEVAMNLGDLLFSSNTVKIQTPRNLSFIRYLNELLSEISHSEDESVSDYIKMDWEDWDGNGSDDFMIFMKDGSSLDLGIFLTETKNYQTTPNFIGFENVWAENFLYKARIREIDTADITGDGHADIMVLLDSNREKGSYVEKYALATYSDGELRIERDKVLKADVEVDIWSKAKKRDITDTDGDGKSDVIFITESDDKPIMIIWKSK